MSTLNRFLVLASGLLVITTVATARAEDQGAKKKQFDKNHPRRAQVLNRANNEEKKNDAAAGSGKITTGQANKLNREDQQIKRREQRQAEANGGHITPQEQARDNRAENHVNQQRNNMEQRDAAQNSGAPAGQPAQGATGSAPAGGTNQ